MSYIAYKAQDMGFDAHLTVLYLGSENLDDETEAQVKEYLATSPSAVDAIHCMRIGIDMFGPRRDLPVVRVTVPPVMVWLRNELVREFGNASEFKDWNPHITLDFAHTNEINIPFHINLNELGLY